MCFGFCTKTQTIFNYGPIIALILVAVICTSSVIASYRTFTIHTMQGRTIMIFFLGVVGTIIFSLFSAVHGGGGHFPKGWRPEKKEDEKKLQWCNACEGFKPPRSHHCQTCGHCVAKMDHHCPWINSCVGNNNHFAFLTFVCSVPVGCSYAFVINVFYFMEYCPSIRAALWIAKYQPQFMDEIIFIFVGSIFAIAVTIAVGMLAIFQLMGAAKNQTQIEAWIVEKANNRERETPFVFPYDLGSAVANIKETCNRSLHSDGVDWTVVEGSDQYSLTEEQLAQKKAKRDATETFAIGKSTDRTRGCSFGCRTWWRGPWPCDGRIAVQPGEHVSVWAGNKSWYYGEKVTLVDPTKLNGPIKNLKPRQRGWFPIDCTVQNHKKE